MLTTKNFRGRGKKNEVCGSTIKEKLERCERSIDWRGVPLVGVQGAEPPEAHIFLGIWIE